MLDGLTRRQSEVARLVTEGLTNQQIGTKLHLSRRTVESYVGEILRRWDLPSRAAIASCVQGGRTTRRRRMDPRHSDALHAAELRAQAAQLLAEARELEDRADGTVPAEPPEPPEPPDLPTTQALILEVIAARTRLGETWWTFGNDCRKAANTLADRGLIATMDSPEPRCFMARLTTTGRALLLSDTYTPPAGPVLTDDQARLVVAILSAVLDDREFIDAFDPALRAAARAVMTRLRVTYRLREISS